MRPIAEGLKAIDVDPGKVENIIVSHLHYDHTGNYDLFPRARYHLQDMEMAYATGRHMCHAQLRMPFEEEDVVAMVRKLFAGRVAFHDGEDQIAPGITVHHIGGHSKGLQCVRVATRRGPVVIASDTTHLYAHFEEGRVFPTTYHIGEVLEGYATLQRLAHSPRHVIPGHDPLVLARYPAARPASKAGWCGSTRTRSRIEVCVGWATAKFRAARVGKIALAPLPTRTSCDSDFAHPTNLNDRKGVSHG